MTCLILDEWKNSITWDGWTVSYSSNYNSMKCARKMQFTFLPVDLLIFNDLFCLTLVWCSIFPSFASSILLEVPFLMPFLSFSDAIWTSCYCRCFESYHRNPTATISTSWTDVFGIFFQIYFIPTDWLNLHIEGYVFEPYVYIWFPRKLGSGFSIPAYHCCVHPFFHGRCECQYRDARAPQRWY